MNKKRLFFGLALSVCFFLYGWLKTGGDVCSSTWARIAIAMFFTVVLIYAIGTHDADAREDYGDRCGE